MSQSDKPEAARAGWRLLETSYPFENEMFRLRRDRVEINGQDEMDYVYQERAAAVIILPVTAEGEAILIRQYRYPVDDWCLEIPAGGSHDTGDASLDEVVFKELQEEIGATCTALKHVTFFYSSNSMSDEICHVYLALGAELSQKPQTEETENIEIRKVPLPEALDLARNGHIKTGPCALGLLLCEVPLRQLGLLPA